MKIHHLRNATFVIESGSSYLLIDPMLGQKGTLPPLSVFRHKSRRNPIVSLPKNAMQIVEKTTHALITHCQKGHKDHLDNAGRSFLQKNNIPVICHNQDANYLKKHGINVEKSLGYWHSTPLLGGKITATPAQHGHGWVRYIMANGAGFYIELPDEPSIYISGDTVYTDDVERALTEFEPDIAVVAAGSASVDVGKPILMTLEEVVSFVRTAPKKVIANHLEALNHCPTTRTTLKEVLKKENLLEKVYILDDGETIAIE